MSEASRGDASSRASPSLPRQAAPGASRQRAPGAPSVGTDAAGGSAPGGTGATLGTVGGGGTGVHAAAVAEVATGGGGPIGATAGAGAARAMGEGGAAAGAGAAAGVGAAPVPGGVTSGDSLVDLRNSRIVSPRLRPTSGSRFGPSTIRTTARMTIRCHGSIAPINSPADTRAGWQGSTRPRPARDRSARRQGARCGFRPSTVAR